VRHPKVRYLVIGLVGHKNLPTACLAAHCQWWAFACRLVANGGDGANVLAHHAGNVAGAVDGDGVEFADKPGLLRAHGHAGTALDAGVPADLKYDGFFFSHGFLRMLNNGMAGPSSFTVVSQIFLYSELGLK
jgi:hypothetical protein